MFLIMMLYKLLQMCRYNNYISWAHGYTGNLDTANLFVDASNVTLTKFVYAGQEQLIDGPQQYLEKLL